MLIQHIGTAGALQTPRCILTALAALLATTATLAQPPTSPAQPGYKSVFDGYQAYSDEKLVAWKAANDKLARTRGGRTSTPEASTAEPVPTTATTPTSGRVAAPPIDHSSHSSRSDSTGQVKP